MCSTASVLSGIFPGGGQVDESFPPYTFSSVFGSDQSRHGKKMINIRASWNLGSQRLEKPLRTPVAAPPPPLSTDHFQQVASRGPSCALWGPSRGRTHKAVALPSPADPWGRRLPPAPALEEEGRVVIKFFKKKKNLTVLHHYMYLFSVKVVRVEWKKLGKLESCKESNKPPTIPPPNFHTVTILAYFFSIHFFPWNPITYSEPTFIEYLLNVCFRC